MDPRSSDIETEKNTRLIGFLKPLMICTGTWSYYWTDNYVLNKIYSVYSNLPLSIFVVFYISIIIEILRVITFEEVTETFLLTMGVAIDGTKIIIRWGFYFKTKVLNMMKDIMVEEQTVFEGGEQDIIEYYMKRSRAWSSTLKFLLFSTCFCCFLYIIEEIVNNIVVNIHHKANNESIEYPYLYQMYLLNKQENLVNLYITNSCVVIFVILAGNVSFAISTTLMVFGAVQLKIFQIHLKRIHQIAETSYNNDVALAFKIHIMKHQQLIKVVTHLNESVKSITLGEFLFSSVNCASVVANRTKVSEVGFDAVYTIGYVFLLVTQIFVYAAAANEIKIQSAAIADALYECEWYKLDKNSKKMVLIMFIRAQKPLEISIGPFGAMTNETALMMMKACYSYVAFMNDA